MKKVLALVLAVAMMATVAFAADYKPGKKIEIIGRSSMNGLTETKDPNATVNEDIMDLNTKNYSIKKVSYEYGKALVESITLDSDEDENKLTIKLKADYTTDKEKDLDVTVDLRGKVRDAADVSYRMVAKVGHIVNTISISDEMVIVDGALNKIDDNGTDPYTTLDLRNIEGMVDVEVRVYEGDKFYWETNVDADKKVLIANADADAEISFLNFVGKPSFNSTATVYFYEVDEDGFIYELTGEGKIKKSAAKWSEDDGAWVLKTRTLGSYVFSDKELASAAADDTTTTNPDTGANDVVGIATALAVVSLVAAGAVSLKK